MWYFTTQFFPAILISYVEYFFSDDWLLFFSFFTVLHNGNLFIYGDKLYCNFFLNSKGNVQNISWRSLMEEWKWEVGLRSHTELIESSHTTCLIKGLWTMFLQPYKPQFLIGEIGVKISTSHEMLVRIKRQSQWLGHDQCSLTLALLPSLLEWWIYECFPSVIPTFY